MQLIELKAKYDKSSSELEAFQVATKGMLEKEQSEMLLHKTHDLERKNTELMAGVNTYRSLFDVAANQARTLKLTNKRRQDEEENLLYALREMQTMSQDKHKQGWLYYICMLSRWQEAAANRKYDYVLNDVRNLKQEMAITEARLTSEEDARQEAEKGLAEKAL